ncbi:MAG: hypothetical protein ACOYO0_06910, partial [Sandarakinorhabdus sp.]
MGLLVRAGLVLAVLLMPAAASAQRIQAWKKCSISYSSCTQKCPSPIKLTIEGGKTKVKANDKHF